MLLQNIILTILQVFRWNWDFGLSGAIFASVHLLLSTNPLQELSSTSQTKITSHLIFFNVPYCAPCLIACTKFSNFLFLAMYELSSDSSIACLPSAKKHIHWVSFWPNSQGMWGAIRTIHAHNIQSLGSLLDGLQNKNIGEAMYLQALLYDLSVK